MMTETKTPEGMIQIGVIVEGKGINTQAFIEKEEKLGNTCIQCDGYVMICAKGKKRR
jgi:hypothetical protein